MFKKDHASIKNTLEIRVKPANVSPMKENTHHDCRKASLNEKKFKNIPYDRMIRIAELLK